MNLYLVYGRDLPEGSAFLIDEPCDRPCVECNKQERRTTSSVWRFTGKGFCGTKNEWFEDAPIYICEQCMCVDDSCFVIAPDAKTALELATKYVGGETAPGQVVERERPHLGRVVHAISDETWFRQERPRQKG